MLSDCRHPRFRNLNSTVPVDIVRVKSYVSLSEKVFQRPIVVVNRLAETWHRSWV